MQKYTVAILVALVAGVAFGGADYTPLSLISTNTLNNKTLTSAGSITFDSSVVIDGSASNQMDATLSATGVDSGNLRIISGESANASGDDIGLLVRGTDTGGTAVTYCDINVDMTDAATGTEDATVTVAIPVAGSLTTQLTIDSSGITSAGNVSGVDINSSDDVLVGDDVYATGKVTAVESVTGGSIAITESDSVGTNAAAIAVTADGAAIDYTDLFTFSDEGVTFIGASPHIMTNTLSARVKVNGTNYYIGLSLVQ